MWIKTLKHLSNLYSRQSLCIRLRQVQFVLLNIQLFHFIGSINRNYILQNSNKNIQSLIVYFTQKYYCCYTTDRLVRNRMFYPLLKEVDKLLYALIHAARISLQHKFWSLWFLVLGVNPSETFKIMLNSLSLKW